jgi:hypothetical protein
MREMSPRVDRSRQAASDGGGSRRLYNSPPRDLIDFYRRWPEFREIALRLAQRADLSAPQRETINWLILLVDRIDELDSTFEKLRPRVMGSSG